MYAFVSFSTGTCIKLSKLSYTWHIVSKHKLVKHFFIQINNLCMRTYLVIQQLVHAVLNKRTRKLYHCAFMLLPRPVDPSICLCVGFQRGCRPPPHNSICCCKRNPVCCGLGLYKQDLGIFFALELREYLSAFMRSYISPYDGGRYAFFS